MGWIILTRTLLEGAYHAAAQPPDPLNPYRDVRHAATAVIMSQAALESFINEQIQMAHIQKGPKVPPDWEQIRDKLIGGQVRELWKEYPKVRYGRGFDAGRDPFQAFSQLVTLRNLIAHYAPQLAADNEALPNPDLERALKRRYDFTPIPEGQIHGWPTRVLNLACARWACETARAMIKEYARITGTHDLFTPHATAYHASPPMYPPPPWEAE